MWNKNNSPVGTLWAKGTTDNLENLDFDRFRATFPTKIKSEIIGTDLVLLLEEENIAIDIKFTQWSGSKLGGFSYSRSTAESDVVIDVPPLDETTIWDGEKVTFTKTAGANPTDEASQDRITNGVSLTRGNSGSLINAVLEDNADNSVSPRGPSGQ